MMNSEEKLPTPYDLMTVPQLATIAVLELSLEMTARALFAEHPDLCDPEKPYWIPTSPATKTAESVLKAIDALRRKLNRYRSLLPADSQPPYPDVHNF